MAKGILKRYSLPGMNRSEDSDAAAAHSPLPKRVSFDGAEPASVFEADEWDRSPAEVTLKLTYKDVMELRQLNVSLIGMGPHAMARTPSRRPTRQRTTTPQSPAPTNVKTSPMQHSSPGLIQTIADKSSSPVFGIRVPPPSPTYQPFSSNSLSPLSEDTSHDDEALSSDPYFEENHSTFHSGSPPGLPVRTPRLKGLASSALPPPSPLRLPSPLSPRSPSPKPATSPSSPCSPTAIPLYRHPRVRSRTSSVVKNHGSNTEASSPMPVILPSLTHQASVPDKLSLSFNKLNLGTEYIDGRDSPSPTWKPTELAGMDVVVESNSSSRPIPNKDVQAHSSLSYPTTPVVTRKTGKGLMGWELKRSSNAGKFGFGRIRQ